MLEHSHEDEDINVERNSKYNNFAIEDHDDEILFINQSRYKKHPQSLSRKLTDKRIPHILSKMSSDRIAFLHTHVISIYHVPQIARRKTDPISVQLPVISWYASMFIIPTVSYAL